MSEDRETAHTEYASHYTNPEPELTYYGDLRIAALLDFEDLGLRKLFDLSDDDFYNPFLLAPSPTPLQLLGATVAAQSIVTAIRFPSSARNRVGEFGYFSERHARAGFADYSRKGRRFLGEMALIRIPPNPPR